MTRRETVTSQDRIARDLQEERAAALLRISRMLESLVEQLQAARAHLAQLEGDDRERARAAYRELRARALQYRWYLEVQREALGMRHHRLLDEFYQIPPAP